MNFKKNPEKEKDPKAKSHLTEFNKAARIRRAKKYLVKLHERQMNQKRDATHVNLAGYGHYLDQMKQKMLDEQE